MTDSNREQVHFLLDRATKAEIMRFCKERGTTLTFLLQKHIQEILKKSDKDRGYLP